MINLYISIFHIIYMDKNYFATLSFHKLIVSLSYMKPFRKTTAMKTPFIVLFLCMLLTACGSKEKNSANQEQTATEMQEKKLPKAACILWIDKNKEKTLMNKEVRNVKARVHIGELGKITVLEYEKTPHIMLEDKISRCLKTYRVTPEQMEKGNLKEGENIVFLRVVVRELRPR